MRPRSDAAGPGCQRGVMNIAARRSDGARADCSHRRDRARTIRNVPAYARTTGPGRLGKPPLRPYRKPDIAMS